MSKVLRLMVGFSLLASCSAGEFVTNSPGNEDQGPGGEDSGPLTNDPDEPNFGSIRMSVLDSNVESGLGKEGIYTLALESVDGFIGEVALDADGLPDGWEVSFENGRNVTLSDGESTELEVKVDFASTAAAGSQGFSISASNSNVESQTIELSADVENVVELAIANNTGGQEHDFPTTTIRLGTAIRFVNMDTSQVHRIHSDFGGVGFPHQPNNMQLAPSVGAAGGTYEFTVTQPGLYSGWYCHVHGRNVGRGEFDVIE